MCFSLLQVSYRNDKTKTTFTCADEADERFRIKETKDKTEVLKIEVFRCQRIVRKEEMWNEIPYTPPVPEIEDRAMVKS